MTSNKGGRPKFQPVKTDYDTVRALAAAGVSMDRIARCIGTRGIDKKTLYRHFRQEIETSRALVTATAMSKLVAALNNGEAWAVCFWLKCRESWQERQRVDVSGKLETTFIKRIIGVADDEI